jgi:hypothetical protein
MNAFQCDFINFAFRIPIYLILNNILYFYYEK